MPLPPMRMVQSLFQGYMLCLGPHNHDDVSAAGIAAPHCLCPRLCWWNCYYQDGLTCLGERVCWHPRSVLAGAPCWLWLSRLLGQGPAWRLPGSGGESGPPLLSWCSPGSPQNHCRLVRKPWLAFSHSVVLTLCGPPSVGVCSSWQGTCKSQPSTFLWLCFSAFLKWICWREVQHPLQHSGLPGSRSNGGCR